MNNSNSNDLYYFKIDHKNSLEMRSLNKESKMSFSIFATIASIQEDSIGTEINKYFNQLIEKNDLDLFEINISQSNKYMSMFKGSQKDIELAFSVNDVLSSEYETFDFNENTTENIMRILCHCFKCLEKDNKTYQITNHEKMLSAIDNVITSKVDGIKMFYSTNKNNFSSIDVNHFNNSDYIERPKIMNFFTYPFLNNDGNDYTYSHNIPIEMVILINKFQCVRKFEFSMENITKKRKLEIVSILLNSHWLFPHLLEVEFNLTDENIQRDLNEIINTQLSKKCKRISKKTTMYDFSYNKGFKWNPKEKEGRHDFIRSNTMLQSITDVNSKLLTTTIPNNDRNYSSASSYVSYHEYITKSKREFFEMIIIYSYFIAKVKYLKSLSIKYQDSYSYEIKKLLNYININVVDFHFVNFFNKISTITDIALIFNSLDTQSFQEVIGLIHTNTYLLSLKLNLFNSDINYTPASLYKLCNSLKMNINEIFSDAFFSIGKNTFENDEIDHLLINKLLQSFEENLEQLLYVLLNNLKIQELIFYLDLPKIISNNDSYLMVLVKFVFNLLFILMKENHKYKIVKILSPELWFNCSKNPFIEEYLEEINLEREDSDLKCLTIQLGFYHVENIGNFLFTKLEYLFIGDLDKETFDAFIVAYSDKKFVKSSQLISITINLNKTITQYALIQKSFRVYFTNRPIKLKEQNLISFIKIDQLNEAIEIIDIIYTKNKVEFNCIEFNQGGDLLNQVLHSYYKICILLVHVFSQKTNTKQREDIVKSIRRYLHNSKPYAFKCRY